MPGVQLHYIFILSQKKRNIITQHVTECSLGGLRRDQTEILTYKFYLTKETGITYISANRSSPKSVQKQEKKTGIILKIVENDKKVKKRHSKLPNQNLKQPNEAHFW